MLDEDICSFIQQTLSEYTHTPLGTRVDRDIPCLPEAAGSSVDPVKDNVAEVAKCFQTPPALILPTLSYSQGSELPDESSPQAHIRLHLSA